MKNIPDAVLEQHVAVLGKTRSGKSSVMRGLVEGLLERELPACIVDPKGDWWGIKLARDGKRPGYPVVIFGGEHADVPINAHAGAHVAELFATGNRPCLIDLGGWMVGERTRFWIDFASSLFRHTRGNRWLIVDEIHNFAPKGKVMDPDSGKALHWTNRLASEGLGKGVHMLFASQRPQKVHNDTLTSAETLIAMRVLHPSDRGAVSDWIKGCGDLELGSKVLNSLAQMGRGEGWVWSPEIGFGPERVKFPMFGTYDSFRPQTAEDAKALKGWAEVDLDEVKEKLAAVVKEAGDNDPKRLHAENARLRLELERKPPHKAMTAAAAGPRREDVATITALRKALEETMKFVIHITAEDFFKAGGDSIDQVAIEKAITSATDQVKKMVAASLQQRDKEIDSLRRDGQRVINRLKGLLDQDVTINVAVRHNEPFTVSPAASAPRPRPVVTGPGVDLPKGERTILTAVAQHPGGTTREQLTVLTGYKRSSRDSYIQRLRERELVSTSGDRIAATNAGFQALGADFEPLPTGVSLRAYWMGRLPEGEKRVLQILVESYPNAVDREEISKATNYQRSSRDSYLQRLGARRLVVSEGRGMVKASEILFGD